MKATQVIYLVVFAGIVFWIISSTDLLDFTKDGFKDLVSTHSSEPIIPKILAPTSIKMDTMPNPATLDTLPFGPYLQTPSTGSYQFKDPSSLPADLSQLKKLNEDIRSFLVFEGVNLTDTSDPSVQLPLTQLRADSQRLHSEITVLDKNPGIDSQLTQQELADIQGSLTFLQRKVRLFETSGVINNSTEGFQDSGAGKTKATSEDLINLQKRIYGAILTLSASGTLDPVVQSRIQSLQNMYTAVTDMVTKLANGTLTESNISVYKEDINTILPNLADTQRSITGLFNQESGKKLNRIEKHLSTLVGEENATSVFNNLKDRGTFRVNVELGYNGEKQHHHRPTSNPRFNQSFDLKQDGTLGINMGSKLTHAPMNNNLPFDSVTPGMDDRAESMSSLPKASRFDWKKRVESICEQVRLRGLDPEDFGCIPKDSLMSPAYSWRGHAKMICGRLGATMDPGLPISCGCPPSNWKGWTLSV